jgi:glycosyltransferase involved in cell wall biosynthesis
MEKPEVVSIKFAAPHDKSVTEALDMITCEYPPQTGGIADYSREIAAGLSRAGIPVRIWAPGNEERATRVCSRVTVVRSLGRFGLLSLVRTAQKMRRAGAGRRLLLQWEPVGYGFLSVNVLFCLWIAWQTLWGAQLIVMFHETFLSYSKKTPKRFAAATLQRLMAFLLVQSARKVFVSTASGTAAVRKLSFARDKVEHLPVFSNIESGPDSSTRIRRWNFVSEGETLVGHFGRYNSQTEALVIPTLEILLRRSKSVHVLFAGECADAYRKTLIEKHPELKHRVHSAGVCTPVEVSSIFAACDFMFQPYPDGITTRRSTAMAALANGCFFVSNKGAASEELWQETAAVHLLRGRTPDEQAREMDSIARSRERIARGAEQAVEFYHRHFSFERTLSALSTCLQSL